MRLVERLQLSPDQEKSVREILSESRKQMEALRAESAPRFSAIRAEMDRKIEALLNDQQKQKFREFLKEMTARRERMRRRPEVGPSLGAPPK
jgi:predicted secreted Zn-dependent protease